MPTLITDTDAIRRIALAKVERGRTSTFGYFSEYFESLEVGGIVALDDSDLDKYRDEVSYIVATVADEATLTKAQRAVMTGLTSSLRRELRKLHGESSDLRPFYGVEDNGETFYAVERTA